MPYSKVSGSRPKPTTKGSKLSSAVKVQLLAPLLPLIEIFVQFDPREQTISLARLMLGPIVLLHSLGDFSLSPQHVVVAEVRIFSFRRDGQPLPLADGLFGLKGRLHSHPGI